MPAAGNSVEAAAIEAAYKARVETLFMGLATNLGDAPASEQQNVDRFTKGLNTARRARQLALNAARKLKRNDPSPAVGSLNAHGL